MTACESAPAATIAARSMTLPQRRWRRDRNRRETPLPRVTCRLWKAARRRRSTRFARDSAPVRPDQDLRSWGPRLVHPWACGWPLVLGALGVLAGPLEALDELCPLDDGEVWDA